MRKEYLETLGKNIRYMKEYIGNDTYRVYIKKNEIELLEQALIKAQDQEKELQTLEILKKYIYYSPKSHCIRMKEIRKSIYNFDYEDLKEVFEK